MTTRQRVLITSSAEGIGRATAQRCREEGYEVVGIDRDGDGTRADLFECANPPGSPATQAIINAVPVGRMGEPDDIAHAIAFLLDARSGFITGQVLDVCGGMTVGA